MFHFGIYRHSTSDLHFNNNAYAYLFVHTPLQPCTRIFPELSDTLNFQLFSCFSSILAFILILVLLASWQPTNRCSLREDVLSEYQFGVTGQILSPSTRFVTFVKQGGVENVQYTTMNQPKKNLALRTAHALPPLFHFSFLVGCELYVFNAPLSS